MFYKIKMFLRRFFYGRNGFDALCFGLLAVYFIISLINTFIESFIVYLIGLGVIIYMFFRALSKNIYKRRKENEWFMGVVLKIKDFLKPAPYDPNFVFKKCPKCKTKLRLPRRSGKHIAVCPKCKNEFKVKIK